MTLVSWVNFFLSLCSANGSVTPSKFSKTKIKNRLKNVWKWERISHHSHLPEGEKIGSIYKDRNSQLVFYIKMQLCFLAY